jgi:hypothetical protein
LLSLAPLLQNQHELLTVRTGEAVLPPDRRDGRFGEKGSPSSSACHRRTWPASTTAAGPCPSSGPARRCTRRLARHQEVTSNGRWRSG